ncbi:MAG: dipeptide ABC transporter ATP-binding protein [Omnitrophica bacterium]|nr:dipeptide ABC transporter ATP-binding protein [Candidatus Omnitrophota bacterium]
MKDLVTVDNLVKHFLTQRSFFKTDKSIVRAVDGVSLVIEEGQTLGLVGESGCGKSTLGRLIAGLLEPTSGKIQFDGKDLTNLNSQEARPVRRNIQVIFQDPYASLNPRMSAGQIIGEALLIHHIVDKSEITNKVKYLLDIVGLSPEIINRYPHQFSGGQRQRIGIARSLSLTPKLIIADEPVSSLDVSIQAQIINLLVDLQKEFGLTYLFIAHDLRVIAHISDRVAVMYLGKIVEVASSRELYQKPYHPYTEALLSAIPRLNPVKVRKRIILKGDIPSPINPPSGCRFHTRCIYAQDKCKYIEPELIRKDNRQFACHFPLD